LYLPFIAHDLWNWSKKCPLTRQNAPCFKLTAKLASYSINTTVLIALNYSHKAVWEIKTTMKILVVGKQRNKFLTRFARGSQCTWMLNNVQKFNKQNHTARTVKFVLNLVLSIILFLSIKWSTTPRNYCPVSIPSSGQEFHYIFIDKCFVHPIFGEKVKKIWKYYIVFVYFARQDGQDGKKHKENHATKVIKIPKTKRRKYGMNETKIGLTATNLIQTWLFRQNAVVNRSSIRILLNS
jgi:hypothetical protein